MLQTKDLVKIYRPKKGVPVTALDKVNISFPEKGMVFLLGKSGSGKSTLLNLLGGLDTYTDGEIIIKGVSSKYFRPKHFDSYRNTYLGFIFQEYNVLEEFTVGANIALAIELQNRKATDEEINDILKEVDLEGFGNRKPNELSGGQKQRVAIARALVKNPEIIMADEPTGALDSATGTQVLQTLKKLSKDKLVIVVSHDREFAEKYADRIIELADGKVINDVERDFDNDDMWGIAYKGNTIQLPEGYRLSEDDRIAINEYIDKLKQGAISLEFTDKPSVTQGFVQTDQTKIKRQDGSSFKLIKSRLPAKNAVRIGMGTLGYKKMRLAITILLSCISFALFGLADTFSAFNDLQCRTNTLNDSDLNYVSVSKVKYLGNGEVANWREEGFKLSNENLKDFEENTGVKMHGVYVPEGTDLSFEGNTQPNVKLTETEYNVYNKEFSGIATINQDILDELGFEILAGKLPDGNKNEIAISEYIYKVFAEATYADGTYTINRDGVKIYNYYPSKAPKHMVGRFVMLNGTKYTITAVIDTGFDLDRYLPLTEYHEKVTDAQKFANDKLMEEFNTTSFYSYASVMMVGDGFIDKLIEKLPNVSKMTDGELVFTARDFRIASKHLTQFDKIDTTNVFWVDGVKTELGENEIIVTDDAVAYDGFDADDNIEGWTRIFKTSNSFIGYADYIYQDVEDRVDAREKVGEYKVVGIIENTPDLYSTVICHDSLYKKMVDEGENVYDFAVGSMPSKKSGISKFVKYCYPKDERLQFWIRNAATWNLDNVSQKVAEYATLSFYIGLGFAVFAAIMLGNFIATSISHKKEEIGILRAIGSRGRDVFNIFFVESGMIAIINFLLSTVIVAVASNIANNILRKNFAMMITVLDFSFRQVILLLLVSIFVAFIASYLPVRKAAKMKPIDAIRKR